MKAVTFLCATLVMAPVMAGELVAHAGRNTIRLAEGQCTSETVLRRLEPELQSQFRAASVVLEGSTFTACWRITPAGAHLVYEDGDQGLVPFNRLKPLISI